MLPLMRELFSDYETNALQEEDRPCLRNGNPTHEPQEYDGELRHVLGVQPQPVVMNLFHIIEVALTDLVVNY